MALWKSRIPEIVAELPQRMDAVTLAVAEGIAKQAAANAPRDTGRLAESLEAKPHGMEGAVVMAMFYYFFVEFGTQNQGARPFLIPAVEMMRGGVAEVTRVGMTGL